MADQVSVADLYNAAGAAQKATEEMCDTFPPFEGLAASIQLKKAAKAAVAHIGEGRDRYNAGDRIRLFGLATESIERVTRGLRAALDSELAKPEDLNKLQGEWTSVAGLIRSYVIYLEDGGEMESPLPNA